MRLLSLLAFLLLFWLPLSANAAGERHALVIGNASYGSSSVNLRNPLNDARDVADQLALMGYQVFGGGPALDLDTERFDKVVLKFVRDLPVDAHVVVYYAGHGMGGKEDNYLIPVRHQIKNEAQLRKKAVSVMGDIIAPLTEKNPGGINVVLLDACRNNPLGRKSRGLYGGFRDITDIQQGVFIGYAAGPGKVADDGQGRNGTYTAELLRVLCDSSHKIIELAHKEVADSVFLKTAGQQFPVSENKIYGKWCFGQCDKLDLAIPPVVAQQAALPITASLADKPDTRMLLIGGIALAVIAVLAGNSGGGGSSTNDGASLVLTPP